MYELYGYIGAGIELSDIQKIAFPDRETLYFGFSYLKKGKLKTVRINGDVRENEHVFKDVIGSNVLIGQSMFENSDQAIPFHKKGVSVICFGEFQELKRLTDSKSDSEEFWHVLSNTDTDPLFIHETFQYHSVLIIQNNNFIITSRGLTLYEEWIPGGRTYCSRSLSENSIKLVKFIEIINITQYVFK